MKRLWKSLALTLCAVMTLCMLGGCAEGGESTPATSGMTTGVSTTARPTSLTAEQTTTTVTTAVTTTTTTTANKTTATTKKATTTTKKPTTSATTTTTTKEPTTTTTIKPIEPIEPILPEKPTKAGYDSLAQQAVVETALAYLARSSRIQYADTRLATGEIVPSGVRYRWQTGVNSPEDATSQYYAYTNCAAFTYDVYYHALNYDILSYTTASLIEKGAPEMVYKYFPKGTETPEEMAEIEKKFRDTLKMGDIIVVRYNGSRKGNGHAMLYVGKDVLKTVEAEKNNAPEGDVSFGGSLNDENYKYDIIHSSGSNYSYSEYKEKFEENGSISLTSVDMLFDGSSSRYVFSKLISVGIVRPLNLFEGEVPQESINRIDNLYGIMTEKLSSHTVGMTVNPGEEMEFTFVVENQTGKEKTLEICDTVPTNTTYISGAQKVNGAALSWTVTVPAHGKTSVSYKVKVNEGVPYGNYIVSDGGSVGGVSVVCPSVMVAKTLTSEQQDKLLETIGKFAVSELEGPELLNAIYKEALGEEVIPDSMEGVLNKVFMPYLGLPDYFSPNNEGVYAEMMVPTMYGGRATVPDFGVEEVHVRTRLPYTSQVMVGDILVAAETGDNGRPLLYLLAGDKAYNLLNGMTEEECNKRLEKMLGYNRFVILRPSMNMQ